MQCKEFVHVHALFLTCFTLLSKADVRSTFDIVCSSRQKSTTLSQIQRIKSAWKKIQKQDLQKQHGITDVENALLHLPMNLHRYAYHSVYLYSSYFCMLGVLHLKFYTHFF